MTLYFSMQKKTYQLLKSIIPTSIETHFSREFSISEYRTLNPLFFITEFSHAGDFQNISAYPY